jgi:hypothetical protein
MASGVPDHVADAVRAAMSVSAPASRSNPLRTTEQSLCNIRFNQHIELCQVDPPNRSSIAREPRPAPTRCFEVLMDCNAVRDSTYRTESKRSQSGQSADVITDHGNPTLMEIAACLDVGRSLLPCRVVSKVFDL